MTKKPRAVPEIQGQRTCVVKLRFTEDERDEFYRRAAEARRKPAEYGRLAVLGLLPQAEVSK